MKGVIPQFDLVEVVLAPWTRDFSQTFWVVLMGFVVIALCGVVGNFLLLKRMVLLGDAMSHSLLFGIAAVFVFLATTSAPIMFAAAVITGLLTAWVTQLLTRVSCVKEDAAMCVVFTTLFSTGVLLLSTAQGTGNVHLDLDAVLFGELAFVTLKESLVVGGLDLGPGPVWIALGLLVGVVGAIKLFYRELLITTFDPGLADALGMRTGVWQYGFLAVLSVVIVTVFESAGSVLPFAMLVVPGMFAAQISDRLPKRLVLTVLHAVLASLGGYHLSLWWQCSTAGAMVLVSALLFVVVWIVGGVCRMRQR